MLEKSLVCPYKYRITDTIINLIAEIGELVGVVAVKNENSVGPYLRGGRENRIRAIYSTLAMESNSLPIEQVTDVINGRRVLGDQLEILAVKNAFEAYDLLLLLDPFDIRDLLKAHKILMTGLVKDSGCFRSRFHGRGVFAGKRLDL